MQDFYSLHRLSLPDLTDSFAASTIQMLRKDHALCTENFTANVVCTCNTPDTTTSKNDVLSSFQEQVGASVTLETSEVTYGTISWMRITGIILPTPETGLQVSQVCYVATHELQLISFVFSVALEKMDGLTEFAETYMQRVQYTPLATN